MNRTRVKSSNIASVGYDKTKQLLDIEFVNGGLYRYYQVPQEVYNTLMKADSLGEFHAQEIKNKYSTQYINSIDYIKEHLTQEHITRLVTHFDSIYECDSLSTHEYKIIYLAWLWLLGFVYSDESGGMLIDEKNSELSLDEYEITIEDDSPGGTNLEITHSFYELDKIMEIIKDL